MKSPAFQFYANDFLGGKIATYEIEEIGLYSVLLAFDWSLTGLPTDDEKLAKLARISVRKFRKLWATVRENFVERDGRYYNPRLELERAKQAENRAKKSAAAHSRWNADAHADALQMECPSSPTPSASPDTALPLPRGPEEARLCDRAVEAWPVIHRFLSGKDEAARMAWTGRFHGAMDRPPHHTGPELRDALEDLMTRPREDWTPVVFRRFLERIRRDAGRAAERASGATVQPIASALDTGEAGRVFAAIRALIREVPNPGRAPIRSLPKTEVAALGPAALAAYEQIGGATRFLDQDEKIGFVLRDFTAAYRAASAPARSA